MALLLADLRARAEEQLGDRSASRIVVGRPVHFAQPRRRRGRGARLERLRERARRARLDRRRLRVRAGRRRVLLRDDARSRRARPHRRLRRRHERLLAHRGRPFAPQRGKARRSSATTASASPATRSTREILHHLVAPLLGLGSTYRVDVRHGAAGAGVDLRKLRRWHHLSFLKTKKNIEMLEEIVQPSGRPGEDRRAPPHPRLRSRVPPLSRRRAGEGRALDARADALRLRGSAAGHRGRSDARRVRELDRRRDAAMAACVDRLLAKAGVDRARTSIRSS